MNHTMKSTGKTMSMTGGLLRGAVVSIMITVLGAMLLAKLLENNSLEWENVGYGIVGVLLLASFVGTKVSINKIKRRRMLVSVESCGIYYAALMLITGLFFGAKYEAMIETFCLVAAGSACALLLRWNSGRAGERSRRKKRK